jgi:hypothetical protein
MNDFDRYLEFELRQMLDPVVATKAPRRWSPKSAGSPLLAAVSASIDLVVDAMPAVEPVVIPVQPYRLFP